MTRYITGFHTIADLANWSGSTVVDNGMLCKKSVRVFSRNPALVNGSEWKSSPRHGRGWRPWRWWRRASNRSRTPPPSRSPWLSITCYSISKSFSKIDQCVMYIVYINVQMMFKKILWNVFDIHNMWYSKTHILAKNDSAKKKILLKLKNTSGRPKQIS